MVRTGGESARPDLGRRETSAPRDGVAMGASDAAFAGASADWSSDPERPDRAALARYRPAPPAARHFARWKLRLDPMFPRLAQLVGPGSRLLDVGCGLAVPATWLLAGRDARTVVATEPDPGRAAIARLALGARGVVHELAAPALPDGDARFDAALLLDVAHYLDDEDLAATLTAIRARLRRDAPAPVRRRMGQRRRANAG
jgi:SAM-dependent methyltransferase